MDGNVDFVGNEARFRGQLKPEAYRHFLVLSNSARKRKHKEIVVDFAQSTHAYPNSMVPLIAEIQSLRSMGINTRCLLPKDDHLRRLFLNSNWAHLIDPASFDPSDDVSDRHLSARRFVTADEQQVVVNEFVEVAMRTLELDRSILAGLEWCINELTDNVLNHAQSALGGIVQLSTFRDKQRVAFRVADSGRGILHSLREAMPNLGSDQAAIGAAVRAGVTRNKDIGQGNGLSGSSNVAIATEGWFSIASGASQMTWTNEGPRTLGYNREKYQKGTIVDVQLSTAKSIDLPTVLAEGTNTPRYTPIDRIELRYLSEDGKYVNVSMQSETFGFGSRRAGEQMRTKVKNLLSAEPDRLLLLDWDGIQMISSSYADEFIGKLFVELGPLRFMSCIRHANMIPVIQQLVDRAILQRTSQTMSGK